ncbi:hypothetical protein PR048_026719 [Dryococelus australis]|uniref:Uncharacterized protein n=1 Tax=Dryococelus australis TaxID=614101 RepID=A0ABQ9GM50_9NEOP|nr:hypothetical protein PR048_026719 [Dryococelus australis]
MKQESLVQNKVPIGIEVISRPGNSKPAMGKKPKTMTCLRGGRGDDSGAEGWRRPHRDLTKDHRARNGQRDFEVTTAGLWEIHGRQLRRTKEAVPQLPVRRRVRTASRKEDIAMQQEASFQYGKSREYNLRMAVSQEGSEFEDQYISVTSAVKLITQLFNGSKGKLREFLDNVDTAFVLVHPDRHSVLLKFVKSKIVGDAKSKILVRERSETWEDVKEILEENYVIHRTIDYYACTYLLQGKEPSEGSGKYCARQFEGSRITGLYTTTSTLALVRHLARACFMQGLNNNHIQTIIRNKGTHVGTLGLTIVASLEKNQIYCHEKIGINQPTVGRWLYRKTESLPPTAEKGTLV